MYIAKENFNSYMLGKIKKGDELAFNKTWLEAGMIEKKPEQSDILETKPEPKKAKKTKAKK